MKYNPDDEVIIDYNGIHDAIIVEFNTFNYRGLECYWVKLKNGERWFETEGRFSRNDGYEHSFWVGFMKPKNVTHKEITKRFGIVKFCEMYYK